MNLEYLGAELNLSVLAGCRPDYELEFTCGADRLNVSDVTFSGVVTAADGQVQPIAVQHTSAINLLRVEFPLMEKAGDYLWEIAYHVGDGKRCRVAFGRLGVLATSLVKEVAGKAQGARRLSVRMPEVAGGQVQLEWQGTSVALYAANEAKATLNEAKATLNEAQAMFAEAQQLLQEARSAVVQRVIIESTSDLPSEGHRNVQYLVKRATYYLVYLWAKQVDGSFGWVQVGTQAEAVLLQADTENAGAVRLAKSVADDAGVMTAKQVREYVQDGAGYVTEESLEPYAKTSEVAEQMAELHKNVLTSDNATRFVEISRADFEALQDKANNVYYLIYDSTI